MNREEILRKSCNDNKGYDERELNVHTKSSAIAKAVGVVIAFVIVLIEEIFCEHPPVASMAAFSVCFAMNAVESWYRFVSLKGKFNLIKSVLCSAFAVAFMVCLIHFLLKVL